MRAELRLAAAVVTLVLLAGCSSSDDGAAPAAESTTTTEDATRVPNPVVTEATGGHGEAAGGMRYDVGAFGYQEREYLFEGTATAHPESAGPPAPYRSRMIVWTPTDPDRFNGTTVVEWAHVSDYGQFELTVELNYQSSMLEREGYAFALVSAEERGICHPVPEGCTATSLRTADPERYGTLEHPGDAYSFDIFSQAMQAIKHPSGVAPLGDLDTEFVIAEGFQPSIDKWYPNGAPDPPSFADSPLGIYGPLNAYLANGADDEARLADGFLIDAAAPADEPEYRVPTIHHLDESAVRRTPTEDSANHVTWEVVGAPHADRWVSDHIHLPSSDAPEPKLTEAEEAARQARFENYGQEPDAGAEDCAPGRSTGSLFPRQYTVNAALAALHEWLETGEPAPGAPRTERPEQPPETPATTLRRDQDGNAIGGLRLPIIEVPVAGYEGEACVEAGTTSRFTPEHLAELYPTHQSYVEALLEATDAAVDERYLLCEDAVTVLRGASESTVGGTDEFSAEPSCAGDQP